MKFRKSKDDSQDISHDTFNDVNQTKKSFFNKRKRIIIVGTILALSLIIIIIGLNSYIPSNATVSEQVQIDRVEPTLIVKEPMDSKTFNKCVELEILIVDLMPYSGEKIDPQTAKIIDEYMASYNNLGCKDVESQITETARWIHRND